MNNQIVQFQKDLGYQFNDEKILEIALTHSSYRGSTDSNTTFDNERLEFLGDAFLDAIIGEYLYRNCPNLPEGEMSKNRALIVCEKTLAEIGRQLNLGNLIQLGKGEEIGKGREKNSIIADSLEAIIGAIYIDGGFENVKKTVLSNFEEMIKKALKGQLQKDYKTALQELIQGSSRVKISYVEEKEEGPDHDKTFFVALKLDDEMVSFGQGKTKKEAEQKAAMVALERGLY